MIDTYALTKKDSDRPIEIGTLGHICSLWGDLKYRNAIYEEFSVKKIKIMTTKELTEKEIGIVLDDTYEDNVGAP